MNITTSRIIQARNPEATYSQVSVTSFDSTIVADYLGRANALMNRLRASRAASVYGVDFHTVIEGGVAYIVAVGPTDFSVGLAQGYVIALLDECGAARAEIS